MAINAVPRGEAVKTFRLPKAMLPYYLTIDADGDWAFVQGTATPDGYATTDGDGELAYDAAAVSGRVLRRHGDDMVAL